MQVQRRKLKVQPDEMRLVVRKSRVDGALTAAVDCGPEFPAEQFDFMVQQLTASRVSVLSTMPGSNCQPEEPFVDSWCARGYDTSTLRFSIRHLTGKQQRYPKARLGRQRPGVLWASWGREEHDTTGDLCVCWRVPCSKRDSNHFHSWLSMPLALPDFPRSWDRSLLSELERRGFDVPSIRFEVHHQQRRAALDALAVERESARAARSDPAMLTASAPA